MIISASYKTDIPTFYGEWFIRRLRAGYCKMVNPYSHQVYRIALDRASVDGFVFWTKNASPFLRHLVEVRERGFPFVVQYTINGYPRAIETSVVDSEKSVETAWKLRDQFGPLAVVWRYDTIILSTITPLGFHLDNFRRLAGRLRGATDEVVVSFAHVYRKTKRNLDAAAREVGFTWEDPALEEKRQLLTKLMGVARENGLRLTVCSQRDVLVEGTSEARCVDADRLMAVAESTFRASLKGNRRDCGCFESRDIGDYDTCPHGCVYCYAVADRELALTRFREHDVSSEFLFRPDTAVEPERRQLPLFEEN